MEIEEKPGKRAKNTEQGKFQGRKSRSYFCSTNQTLLME